MIDHHVLLEIQMTTEVQDIPETTEVQDIPETIVVQDIPETDRLQDDSRGRGSRNFRDNDREDTTVTCADCGDQCTVPFVPRSDKPVYCSDCFRKTNPDEPDDSIRQRFKIFQRRQRFKIFQRRQRFKKFPR